MADEIDSLPPTAYGVLGLLALRSWTGYELTQQAQRSFRFCWPKEDSILYAQPRRLEALGLARSEKEAHNGRNRNRYWITPAGRRALRRWLATESAPPQLMIEPLLRMMFVDFGTVDDAQRNIAVVRTWVAEQTAAGLGVLETYGADDEPFPERRHLNALNALFYAYVLGAMAEWGETASDALDRWDPAGPAPPRQETQALVEEARRRGRSLLDRLEGTSGRSAV